MTAESQMLVKLNLLLYRLLTVYMNSVIYVGILKYHRIVFS